jgi:hypothetical protein
MKISSDILRRLSALNLPGDGLGGVLAILADIQKDDDVRLEKQRERSRRSRRNKCDAERDSNVAASSPQRDSAGDIPPQDSSLAKGPTRAELERELFRRGRQVCGKAAGGLIASLLKAKQNDVALARAVVEAAATKHDPREYVAAATRERPPNAKRTNVEAADDLLDKLRCLDEPAPDLRN